MRNLNIMTDYGIAVSLWGNNLQAVSDAEIAEVWKILARYNLQDEVLARSVSLANSPECVAGCCRTVVCNYLVSWQ
jgi:hypothetical protein